MAHKVDTPDDWPLVEAIRDGRQGAFRDLVRRYERQVAQLIFLSLGDREDVKDLSQEVFLRVYHALPRLEPQRSLFSWIYRIATNVVIDETRRRKFRRIVSLEFLAAEGNDRTLHDVERRDPSEDAERNERHAIVRWALERISPEHRLVLLLREYEDLTYEEIATILRISVPAVKSRLFRARAEMKERVIPQLGETP